MQETCPNVCPKYLPEVQGKHLRLRPTLLPRTTQLIHKEHLPQELIREQWL